MVKTEAFDFSDVFAAGANDLRFLDREYRRKLAKEVIEQLPEIFSEIKVRKVPFKASVS